MTLKKFKIGIKNGKGDYFAWVLIVIENKAVQMFLVDIFACFIHFCETVITHCK